MRPADFHRTWNRKRIGILFVLLFCSMTMRAQVGLSPDEQKMFDLLNQEREKAGLPKLQWDYHLAESARKHAELLAQQQKLSHQFPGEPGLAERIGATGLRFTVGAENVAEAGSVEDMHAGLMNSPPHRANILSTEYNAVGLAVTSHGNELFAAQNFAHVLPFYSEDQFRSALVAAFNKARKDSRVGAVTVHSPPRMHELACAASGSPREVMESSPGATDVVVYTSSIPENFPGNMKKLSAEALLQRMDIGVCFRPDSVHGYGTFWVVAAFYP
jgi:hypothetical protein